MHTIPEHLSLQDIPSLLASTELSLSVSDRQRVEASANYLYEKIATGKIFYGINTGFGSLCDVSVSASELSQLQENLVCSHACGMGEEVPSDIVRIMMLLKIKNIIKGHSGIHPDTLDRLIFFYNNHITPVVYQQGSLGASGDLAPLAHLSLPLLGKGEVYWNGKKTNASEMLAHYNLSPLKLHAKEGLGLLNGTQFMSAYAVWAMLKSQTLMDWADAITAISADAFNVKSEPFHHLIHAIRPHPGQQATAAKLLSLLENSEIQQLPKKQVQDPYSFRCVPQVHGASKDALKHIQQVLEIEINSVTDNPLVFGDEDHILSGGNFHGQPLAINLDYMAIAMAELANISERRTYLLISGQRELPMFLTPNPGLNSGMMIAQYTAASIVSQNKQLCTPASVDSIVSSNGQEDHVSMGANAATKLKRVIDNVQSVLAIELLCAAQALEFRRPVKSNPTIENIVAEIRKIVPFATEDRLLHDDMKAVEIFLNNHSSIYTI